MTIILPHIPGTPQFDQFLEMFLPGTDMIGMPSCEDAPARIPNDVAKSKTHEPFGKLPHVKRVYMI